MSYQLELFEDDSILLVTAGVDWSPSELPDLIGDVTCMLDASPSA